MDKAGIFDIRATKRDGCHDYRYLDRTWMGLIIVHEVTLSMRTIVETDGVISRCSSQSGSKKSC